MSEVLTFPNVHTLQLRLAVRDAWRHYLDTMATARMLDPEGVKQFTYAQAKLLDAKRRLCYGSKSDMAK